MRRHRRAGPLVGWQRGLLFSQTGAAVESDPGVRTVRVRFGVNDKAPSKWDGSATATGGSIVRIRNWHPRPGDRVDNSGWSLATRKGPLFVLRPWDDEPVHEPQTPILIPGVLIEVKGTAATRLVIKTEQGNVTVSPFLGKPAPAGNIAVDVVPTPLEISTGGFENDFPTIIRGAGREMWLSYFAWDSAGDHLMISKFDGTRWLPRQQVLDAPGDCFIVKMGRDGKNGIWTIWSQQKSGNFDLYGMRYDGKAWGEVQRLTSAPQPDIYHDVITDSNGNLWLVWQGFRNGKSDIFARRYDGEKWSDEEKVSDSLANDWQPAVAADGAGRVYVAWDTYDQGNYDVRMRSWANGKWDAPMAVASTPRFEAHVSLACDKQNRLWAAWNESGVNWGKDTGFLPKQQGTRLYQWRSMSVAIWDGAKWSVPAADVNTSLPADMPGYDMQGYNDFPILHRAADGRMWLFFRHRLLRIRNVPSDTPAHRAAWEIFGTAYEGKSWSEPLQIPLSADRMDTRGGFADDAEGNLWAAWATDNRDFEEFPLSAHGCLCRQDSRGQGGSSGGTQSLAISKSCSPRRWIPEERRNLSTIHGYEIRNSRQELSYLSRRHASSLGVLHGRQQRRFAESELSLRHRRGATRLSRPHRSQRRRRSR